MEERSDTTRQPACAASSDADSGCALDDYTWVPPGLTAQQVPACLLMLRSCITYTENLTGVYLA